MNSEQDARGSIAPQYQQFATGAEYTTLTSPTATGMESMKQEQGEHLMVSERVILIAR